MNRANPHLGTIVQNGSSFQLGTGGNISHGDFLDLYAGGQWLPCHVQLSRQRGISVIVRMGERRGQLEIPIPQPCQWLFRRVLSGKRKAVT